MNNYSNPSAVVENQCCDLDDQVKSTESVKCMFDLDG